MAEATQFCYNCQRDIVSTNFGLHTAFCERNIKLCESCQEPINKNEFKKHLEEAHVMDACKLCDEALEKWMLPKHQESCLRRLIPCKFCEAEFPFDEYEEHENACGARTEKCVYCRKFIMIRELDQHTQTHTHPKQKIEQECERVQNKINENISKSFVSSVPSTFKKKYMDDEEEIDEKEEMYPKRRPLKERTSQTFPHEKYVDSTNFARAPASHEKDADSTNYAEAAARIPEKSEIFSKHYGLCPICKEYVRWVDMNTHVPSCATDAGKCSRCHENVPPEYIKDHILKYCSKLNKKGRGESERHTKRENYETKMDRSDEFEANPIDIAGYESDEEEPKNCPFCYQMCSKNRILDHIRNCDKNLSDCPLCGEKVSEKDKERHENYYCKVIIEIQQEEKKSPYSRSYADSVKHSSPPYQTSADQDHNYVNCMNCKKRVSRFTLAAHLRRCQVKTKMCRFCHTEIPLEEEQNHLRLCAAVRDDYNTRSKHSSNNRNFQTRGGAIPKHPQMKGTVANCRYCDFPYNIDLLPFHEKECVYQSILCETCGNLVPLKDVESHADTFHFGKGSKSKGKMGNTEKESVFGRLKNFVTGKTKSVQDALTPPCSNYSNYPHPYDTQPQFPSTYDTQSQYSTNPIDYTGGFSSAYNEPSNTQVNPRPETEQILLPCEFCEEVLFDEVDFVAHMSLEHADEVCVKKKNLTKDALQSESSKQHQRRRYRETATTKPGEFLRHSILEAEKEEFQDALEDQPVIQSYWDTENPPSPAAEVIEESRKDLYSKENQYSCDPKDEIKQKTAGRLGLFSETQFSSSAKFLEQEHDQLLISRLELEINRKEVKPKHDEFPKAYDKKNAQLFPSSDMDISPTQSDEEMKTSENSKSMFIKNKPLKSTQMAHYGENEAKFGEEHNLQPAEGRRSNAVEKMDHDGSSSEDLSKTYKSTANIDLKRKVKDQKNNALRLDSSSNEDVGHPQKNLSAFKFTHKNHANKRELDLDRSSSEGFELKEQKKNAVILDSSSDEDVGHPQKTLSGFKFAHKNRANKKETDLDRSSSGELKLSDQNSRSKIPHHKQYLEKEKISSSSHKSSSPVETKSNKLNFDANKKVLLQRSEVGSSSKSNKFCNEYPSVLQTSLPELEAAAQCSKLKEHHNKETKSDVNVSADKSSLNENSKSSRQYCDAYRKQILQQNKINLHSSESSHDVSNKYVTRQHTESFETREVVEDKMFEKNVSKHSRISQVPAELSNTDSEKSSSEDELGHLSDSEEKQGNDTPGSCIITNVVPESYKNLSADQYSQLKHDISRVNLKVDESGEDSSLNYISSFEHIEIEELEQEKLKMEKKSAESHASGLSGFQKTMKSLKSGTIQPKIDNILVKNRASSDPLEIDLLENLPSQKHNERKNSLEKKDKIGYTSSFDVHAYLAQQQDHHTHMKKLFAEAKSLLNDPIYSDPFPNDDDTNSKSSVKYKHVYNQERNDSKMEPAESRFIASKNTNMQDEQTEICQKKMNSISSDECGEQRFLDHLPESRKAKENTIEDRIAVDNKGAFSIETVSSILPIMSKRAYLLKSSHEQVDKHSNIVNENNSSGQEQHIPNPVLGNEHVKDYKQKNNFAEDGISDDKHPNEIESAYLVQQHDHDRYMEKPPAKYLDNSVSTNCIRTDGENNYKSSVKHQLVGNEEKAFKIEPASNLSNVNLPDNLNKILDNMQKSLQSAKSALASPIDETKNLSMMKATTHTELSSQIPDNMQKCLQSAKLVLDPPLDETKILENAEEQRKNYEAWLKWRNQNTHDSESE